MKCKAEPIKETIMADICPISGLGFPPGVCNQNRHKSMNLGKGGKKPPLERSGCPYLAVFIFLQKKLQQQRTEEELALLGTGDLKLVPMYVNLGVPETIFYHKSPAQKQAVLKKFYSEGVKAPQKYCQMKMMMKMTKTMKMTNAIHYPSLHEKAELFLFHLQS